MDSSTKIWPIFRWANWWLSDDLFTGIQNSYYYSNLLEIREDAKSTYPFDRPSVYGDGDNVTLWTETKKPVAIIQSTTTFDQIYVFVWKDVYSVDVTAETQHIVCTFPNDICDADTFNGYVYVSTTWWVYMIQEGASDADWATLWSSTTVTSVEPYIWRIYEFAWVSKHHPLYSSDIILAIWDEWDLLKVTRETCNLVQNAFSLQKGFNIKLITELWGFLRIIASDSMWGSQLLLWDKSPANTSPNEVIPFLWYTFFQTAIYNWYQYLLSDKWLWVINGYQFYILKKFEYWDISSPAYNAMRVFRDKLYFATDKWIYIYWAKNKNYSDVLSLWGKWGNYGCMFTDWRNLFLTRWKSASEWIEHSLVWINSYDAWWQSHISAWWELQTMAYFWTWLSEIKQALYLRVWYKIPSSWSRSGNIHIYYRTDADATTNNPEDWQWHEVTQSWGLYATWDMRSPFATTLKLNCRFQWIQFKFVIDNCYVSTSWTYLYTHLYSADLYYNTMLD